MEPSNLVRASARRRDRASYLPLGCGPDLPNGAEPTLENAKNNESIVTVTHYAPAADIRAAPTPAVTRAYAPSAARPHGAVSWGLYGSCNQSG